MSSWYRLTLVPSFSPDHPLASTVSPRGGRGAYLATFVLAPPGQTAYFDNLNADVLFGTGGDSLLNIPGPTDMDVESDLGHHVIQIESNSVSRLARIRIEVQADDFKDAQRKAQALVMPLVSSWSYRYDVGIDVPAYRVVEESTGALVVRVGLMGAFERLSVTTPTVSLPPMLRPYLAAYRDALSSTNLFHQAIGFYKVIEGIHQLRVSARSVGERLEHPRVPDAFEEVAGVDLEMIEHLRPYLGQKFTAVQDRLRPVIRNAAAHMDPERHLDPDDFDDITACEEALPVLKYMAREMLRAQTATIPNFAVRV